MRRDLDTKPIPKRLPVFYGYARVSTKGQAVHGKSLAEQEAQITAFYHLRGGEMFGRWGEVFRDAGTSAFKKEFSQRKAGGVLYERLQSGDHIVMTSIDRGFRNFYDAIVTIERWMKAGINVHFLDHQISTESAMGKVWFRLMAVFAQAQRDMTSERNRAVSRSLRLTGKLATFDCEYGWKVEGRKGARKLVPYEEQRETIRLITSLRDVREFAWEGIWRYLLQNRILTCFQPHISQKPGRLPGEWTRSAITDAYYYYKNNPQFKLLKRAHCMANEGRPVGAAFVRRTRSPNPELPVGT